MKKTCIGVVLCGWMGLVAGCSEIGSAPSHGVGHLGGDAADDDAAAGDQGKTNKSENPSAAKTEAANAAATPEDSPAAKIAETKAANSGAANGDVATPPKTAAAASNGHLAPQQVAIGGDGRARNVTFDNIKFPMDDPKSRLFKRSLLTESIEKLSGNRVRIRGFILPGPLEEFSNFVLVRDNQECCFGPGAAIYDSIMVDMQQDSGSGGNTVKFTTRPVTVEGVFEIKELIGPDKKHWSIYRLTATKVE